MKSVYPLLKLIWKDTIRSWVYRKNTNSPGRNSLAYHRIIIYLALVFVSLLCSHFSAPLFNELLLEKGILLVKLKSLIGFGFELSFFVLGLLTIATLFVGTDLIEDNYLKSLPLKKAQVYYPKLAIVLLEGCLIFTLLILPLVVLFQNLIHFSFINLLSGSLISLLYFVVYALVALIIVNIVFYFIPGLNKEIFFGFLFTAVFAGILIGLTAFLKLDSSEGLNFYYSLNEKVENFIGASLFVRVLFAPSMLYYLVFLGLLSLCLILSFTFSCKLLSIHDSYPSDKKQSVEVKEAKTSLRFQNVFRGRTRALLNKEWLLMSREPANMVKNLLPIVVLAILGTKLFANRASEIALFFIYSLPATFCGTIILQSIGREGSNILMLKLTTKIEKYFFSKLIVGVIFTIPTTLILAVIILIALPNSYMSTYKLVVRFAAISLVSPIAVMLALGMGAFFADLNVKRLFPDRGVSIIGELFYWMISSLIAFSLVFLDKGILGSNIHDLWLGLPFAMIIVGLSVYFYRIGIREINAYE